MPSRTYHCLSGRPFAEGGFQLVDVRQEDILPIMRWRNNQRDVLRQKDVLTEEGQIRYYAEKIWPGMEEERPRQVLFSFLKDGVCIGYGGVVHIDWESGRGEVAFLLDSARNADLDLFRSDLRIFLRLLAKASFQGLGLNKLTTEVFDIRPYLIEEFERFGFRFQGKLEEHCVVRGERKASLLHALFRGDYENWNPSFGNVLVTSINKKIPLIEAARSAARRVSPSSRICGSDTNADCLGAHFVDEFLQFPTDPKMTLPGVLEACRANGITAVLPTRDGELPFWSCHKQALAEAGIAVMIGEMPAVEACLDKQLFHDKLAAAGYPVIPTAGDPAVLGDGPFVVKERTGAGSLTIGLDLDLEGARRHGATLQQPIYQPMRRGDEFSVDVYVDAKGKAKGAIARKRVVVVGGQSQVAASRRMEKLENLCLGMAETLGLYGHVIFQAIEDGSGNYHVIECNSRFGGASTLSLAMGLDSFYWFFLEACGVSLESVPFRRSGEKIQVRYPKDRVREAGADA
jgi:carbamoyl-phosphate synthase large subunit